MTMLLLTIGVMLGLYGLYRFFINATTEQIVSFVLGVVLLGGGAVLLFLAVTGRAPGAIALLAAAMPFIMNYVRNRQRAAARARGENAGSTKGDAKTSSSSGTMTRREALEVLGVEDGASPKEIKDAYTRLMKKVHPDQEGSKWMAAKLNEAKGLLLDDRAPGTEP